MASRSSKIITIADALKCAAKVKAGKACSAAELRSTVLLLTMALSTARRTARAARTKAADQDNMIGRLMGKIGL